MAKRRRRRPYKPRPVKKPGEDDGTRPVGPDLSDDTASSAVPPTVSDPTVAAAAGIPSTGMPISAPAMAMPPEPEEGYAGGGFVRELRDPGGAGFIGRRPIEQSQGIMRIRPWKESEGHVFARGGAVPSPMPGYSDYTMMKTDPVARRRYSPKHVNFAEGGYVDPMNYIPDQPVRHPTPIQPSRFDQFNLVGRKEPQVNPMLATDQPTGYAKGGPIAAAQVPAYTDPVYPAPSAQNAALYADMAALRGRATNPTPLQLPGGSASAPQIQTDQGGGAPSPGYPPITGTVVTPPKSNYNPNPPQNYKQGDDPWQSPFGQLFDKAARWGYPALRYGYGYNFAEGGAVPDDSAPPPMDSSPAGGPDAGGYIRGDNAMDPDELDGVLQQIAQLDPSQNEDAVNLTAIVQAAQSGDMDRAASILTGFRRRFDRLNATAQGAAAHGDLATAAQLAGKAHSQVPDGLQVSYTPGQDGNSVVATVTPSGQTFQMTSQQFHDYLVGPATSFDHILENGLEQNLAIASGGQSGQQAPGMNPAPTGYAAGGEEGAEEEQPQGYAEGGAVDDDKSYRRGPLEGNRAINDAHVATPGEQGRERYNDMHGPLLRKGLDIESERQTRGYAEGGEVEDEETTTHSRGRRRRKGGKGGSPSKTFADPEANAVAALGPSQSPSSGGYIGAPNLPGPMEYAEGGDVSDDEERRRPKDPAEDPGVIRRVLDHARSLFGFGGGDEAAARPQPLVEPAGGRTALSRGIGYEGPAGGQTAYQAAQDREAAPAREAPQADGRVPTGRGGFAPRPVSADTAAPEPRIGARPVPGPASARRGVEYPEKVPGEDIILAPPGGPGASARRGVGTPTAAAAPEPQQLGSREDISLPPAARPVAGQTAPVNPRQAVYDKAYQDARERGDIYTTDAGSWDRAKEVFSDIGKGNILGRRNTVDYSDAKRQVDEMDQRNAPARAQLGPVDVEERRRQLVEGGDRGQPSREAQQPAAVAPHEQQMREIDKQQELLRQPPAPIGSGVSSRTEPGTRRYHDEMMADERRYNHEVQQRSSMIADQRHQDETIIRAYNDARKDGSDTPELKRAYNAAMYRMSGGKLRIPPEEQPAAPKKESSGWFGGGASAKPAAQGGYGSPGWPPRAPSPGKRWGQDASGRFVEY